MIFRCCSRSSLSRGREMRGTSVKVMGEAVSQSTRRLIQLLYSAIFRISNREIFLSGRNNVGSPGCRYPFTIGSNVGRICVRLRTATTLSAQCPDMSPKRRLCEPAWRHALSSGSVPSSNSLLSSTPSLSVSLSLGSVPSINSSELFNPSLSASSVASAGVVTESWFSCSHSSATLSLSSSFVNAFSKGNGSALSMMPSPSVSAFFGSVLLSNSSPFVSPSPSASNVISSCRIKGSRPALISDPSASPPLSVSALRQSVSPTSTIPLLFTSSSLSAMASPSMSNAVWADAGNGVAERTIQRRNVRKRCTRWSIGKVGTRGKVGLVSKVGRGRQEATDIFPYHNFLTYLTYLTFRFFLVAIHLQTSVFRLLLARTQDEEWCLPRRPTELIPFLLPGMFPAT